MELGPLTAVLKTWMGDSSTALVLRMGLGMLETYTIPKVGIAMLATMAFASRVWMIRMRRSLMKRVIERPTQRLLPLRPVVCAPMVSL
jgi:hypothetical protein